MSLKKFFKISVFFAVLFLNFEGVYGEEKIENYNEVQYIDVEFDITSSIYLTPSGGEEQIEFVKADLSFFPQNTETQEVKFFNPNANPDSLIQEKQDKVAYTWTNSFSNQLDYGINSKIRIKNNVANVARGGKFPPTSMESSVLKYTQATEFIDINSDIEKKANEILGIEDDYYGAVFKLAEWTRMNVDYNLTSLTAEAVKPSSWVLENGEGVCDEITNLFISLSRSVGIPARFVSGMVYTNVGYDWGAHGWAEVYFPEYGWVPFDVTFGEYGWLDPSHLKLKDNMDSGSPTAEYTWKAGGVEVDFGELNLEAFVYQIGPKQKEAVEIEIIPHKSSVGFGSYVPLEVKIKNLENYYIVPKITVLKAPKLGSGNVKTVLLNPNEEKSIFWLMEISDDIDKNYVYTSTLEVKSMFGERGEGTIKYGREYPYYSKEYAESILNSYVQRGKKEEFREIGINCVADKQNYYEGENAKINCNIKNFVNKKIYFDICFGEKCNTVYVEAEEEKQIEENFIVEESRRIPVIVESLQKVKYAYINLDVIPIPEVFITNLDPTKVDYWDDVVLNFELNSNTPVENLIVDFDFDSMVYEKFDGKKSMSIHTRGKNLVEGLQFDVSYNDKNGKEYEEKKAISVEVENVPWYAEVLLWIKGLF